MSSSDNSSSENIRCIVRCRPLNEKETGLGSKCITISSDSKVVFVENKADKISSGKFAMDHVFNENVTQEEVFQEIGEPILKSFIGGYNCTIFCYGQTGAGKTHTMMGPLDQLFEENSPSQGLIPRIIHYLFNEETKVKNIITNGNVDKCKDIKMNIKFCVMELYQESIIDLLKNDMNINSNSNTSSKNAYNDKSNELKIKEDPKKGMYVQGITEVEIKTAKEAKNLILQGLKSRHVAATAMNAESSRSHLLFSIYLTTSYINNRGGAVEKMSRLHLIDLAGSERQKKTKAQGERIKEACMINKSLSTLGNVINALVENYDGKNKYIPFRDSKLTYFLKDSLGGNSKTTIVANISTSLIQMNETIGTLKFVQRAKMIKNSATLNMSVQENIESLNEEIRKLKAIIAKGGKYIDEDGVNNINSSNGNNNVDMKNFVCPICNNQPIEVNQEKIMQKFKEEINKLMELIIKNFTSEENIRKQFMNLDEKIISSGFKFYSLIENYKNEYNEKLKEFDNSIKNLKEFLSKMKENMEKANQKVIEFKTGDSMDKIIFGEINQLNTQAAEILKKLENCDTTNFKKLETENIFLQKENEISKDLKKILELKIRNEIEQKEINSDAKNVKDSVDQFIVSNDKIIKFFAENFLNKPYFKEELMLLEKSKYDMLLFQIGEGKMIERSYKKQMEQMEMDNYLTNIDLIRMKNQLDEYKSKSINSLPKSEYLSQKNNNIYLQNNTKNKEDNKDDKDSKDDDIKASNNESESDFGSNNSSDDDISEEIEKKSKKKVARKGIIRIGESDPTAALQKNKKFLLNVDNLEIVKMMERMDEINDDLSQKISENEELKQQIFDLNITIENLNLKSQENEDNIKELNQQIEALDTTNEAFEKNIEELSSYKKYVEQEIKDMMQLQFDKDEKMKELNKINYEMNDIYKNKCDELFRKNKDLINSNKEKEEIIENKNQMEYKNKEEIKLLNGDINKYKIKILNKDKVINALKENEEFINLQIEEIEKLLKINDNKINNINELYNQDMVLIQKYYNNVFVVYKKSVINLIKNNDTDINEIKQLIKKNNDSFDDLTKVYNSYNTLYFEKCCNLLNVISSQESKNKLLLEKINIKKISEKNLSQKIASIEKENSAIKIELKTMKQSYELIKSENINILKQKEMHENQFKNMNEEINKYMTQIKEKEKIFNEINSQLMKININLKNIENKNENLIKSIEEKNNLITQLQDELNKQNKVIDELNNKNISLIKELDLEKNKDSLYKKENNKNVLELTELNNKMTTLFTELGNKDKIITELNNKHSELSKQINEYISEKNNSMEKIAQKEIEIINLQKKIIELNEKKAEIEQKFNQILDEKKEKIVEISNIKAKLEEKNIVNDKLNNKLKRVEEENKKGISLYNKILANTNNLNLNADEDKNSNGMKDNDNNINDDNININNETQNVNTIIIETLKNKNEELTKENIKIKNEIYKLNMKYIITEKTSNLFFELLNEFKTYQIKTKSNGKNNNNSLILNELFITEKILQCNSQIKSLETELNKKTINLSNISNTLIENFSEYINNYKSTLDTFTNNCGKIYQKYSKDNERNKIKNIFDDINGSLNQLILNNIPINNNINDLIKICNKLNDIIGNKMNIITDIINSIRQSYNKDIIMEEISCEENIILYQNKHLINNVNSKNKAMKQELNDDEQILKCYNEYKKNIISAKNKYKEIIHKFGLYKNDIFNNKNMIEENMNIFRNLAGSDNSDMNSRNNNEEISYEMKLILNKVENDKNTLRQLINQISDNMNINFNINKECFNSVPNNTKLKEILLNDISRKNELEEKLREIKSKYLLMKNLPSNYESFKKYLSISILERKTNILEEKFKLIFGEKFNFEILYNPELKPEIIWNKNDISQIKSEIMILKENKYLLEKDYNALKLAFNSALNKAQGITDNQLIILFKIKEENKQLKKELKKIKEKNDILRAKIKKIYKENNLINTIDINENNSIDNKTIINNNYMHGLANCSLSEIKDNNIIIGLKKKKKYNDSKDNNSILNDISNGFTPKKRKKRFVSSEK